MPLVTSRAYTVDLVHAWSSSSMPADDSAGGGTPLWSLDGAPPDYVLTGVRAVLPDRVLDDARVVVRGLIGGRTSAGVRGDVDGGGLLVVPGLVDVHSDALERERAPRPTRRCCRGTSRSPRSRGASSGPA